MSATTPRAVLWDLDGTIIDSEPYWVISERRLVEEFGGSFTDADGLALIGKDLVTAAHLLASRGVTLPIDEIVDRMVADVNASVANEIPWRPGALDLIRSIHDAGIPQVLVTMSYRSSAEFIADTIGLFAGVVSGNDVAHPKPHPDAYQRGAALVGVEPRECVAIEDSGPGSQSAIAAGAVTIAVPLHVPLPENPDYTLWHSLVGRDVHHITEVFAGAIR